MRRCHILGIMVRAMVGRVWGGACTAAVAPYRVLFAVNGANISPIDQPLIKRCNPTEFLSEGMDGIPRIRRRPSPCRSGSPPRL